MAGTFRDELGHLYNLVATVNYCAVTAACLLIRRSIFQEIGGFDPIFGSHFNDVDLCIRLIKRNYQNVFTPYAELYHHESASRGNLTENEEGFLYAVKRMKELHGDLINNDPYFHVKFSRVSPYLELINSTVLSL